MPSGLLSLQSTCRWKNGGYKSCATCTEVPDMSDDPVPLSDMPAYTIQLLSDMHAGFMNSCLLSAGLSSKVSGL